MSEGTPAQQVDVAVLGAGMVGVSAGLAARQRGLSVVIVDRREPGSETSYGNAGIISSGSILPLNTPSLLKNLPKYLTNAHPALRWNIAWALANAGWVMRFLAAATPSQTRPRAAWSVMASPQRGSASPSRHWQAPTQCSSAAPDARWSDISAGSSAATAY